jgi:hypothetical protein
LTDLSVPFFSQLPSIRSIASLVIVASGCAVYVATDKQFLVEVMAFVRIV